MGLTRYVLPVVVGAMLGMILIKLGEFGIGKVYANAGGLPDIAFVLLIANYMVGSFASGIVASLIVNRESGIPAFVIGIVLTLAGLYNAMHLTHPLWFGIVNLLIFLPFAWLGFFAIRRKAVPGS